MRIVIAGNNEIAFNIAQMLSHEYNITLVGPSEQEMHHLEANERVRLVQGDIPLLTLSFVLFSIVGPNPCTFHMFPRLKDVIELRFGVEKSLKKLL